MQDEKGIKAWPKDDRPREKLIKYGEHTLTNSELLSILVRTGSRGQSAVDLARLIFEKFKSFSNMGHTDISSWKEFKGLGMTKFAQIKAAIEIGRRLGEEQVRIDNSSITSSKDVAEIFAPRMRGLKKEIVKTVFLNTQNRIIEILEVDSGTVNYAQPIIREIFQKALQYFSTFLICVHNHTGGTSRPSPEDIKFTQDLVSAGKIIGVGVLDHIIISEGGFFSFLDEGLI